MSSFFFPPRVSSLVLEQRIVFRSSGEHGRFGSWQNMRAELSAAHLGHKSNDHRVEI